MYGPDGIRAVLDWEMAHYGDPIEDVAFAQLGIWQLGTGLVGGLVPASEWHRLYRESSGTDLDRSALLFWTVLAVVKMTLLMYRASALLAPGREHDLIGGLRQALDDELRAVLGSAGPAAVSSCP